MSSPNQRSTVCRRPFHDDRRLVSAVVVTDQMSCRFDHFGGRPAFARGSDGTSRTHSASVRSARVVTPTLGTRSPVCQVRLSPTDPLETSPRPAVDMPSQASVFGHRQQLGAPLAAPPTTPPLKQCLDSTQQTMPGQQPLTISSRSSSTSQRLRPALPELLVPVSYICVAAIAGSGDSVTAAADPPARAIVMTSAVTPAMTGRRVFM